MGNPMTELCGATCTM